MNLSRRKTYFPAPVLVPASSDMTVLLPTPCFPRTPTTTKSLCSSIYYIQHHNVVDKGLSFSIVVNPYIQSLVLPVPISVHHFHTVGHLIWLSEVVWSRSGEHTPSLSPPSPSTSWPWLKRGVVARARAQTLWPPLTMTLKRQQNTSQLSPLHPITPSPEALLGVVILCQRTLVHQEKWLSELVGM